MTDQINLSNHRCESRSSAVEPASRNRSSSTRRVLATDLDGTLLPPEGTSAAAPAGVALQQLRQFNQQGVLEIVFATGRHIESVLEAIALYELPPPAWVICDVGSSIYQHLQQRYTLLGAYDQHLAEVTEGADSQSLSSLLDSIETLVPQEAIKQRRFKRSYYCDAAVIETSVLEIERRLREHQLPFGVIHSVDPFDGRGLVDVLPRRIDKSYALRWWAEWSDLPLREIVFAGDSGNDLAALTNEFRGILVGNAQPHLVERIRNHHHSAGTIDRIYFAKSFYTAGVLEGVHHYRLLGSDESC